MTSHRRPTIADWRAGLLVGAALGAMTLGAGSRLGMRVIAIAQSQAALFSIEGSLAVVLLGAGAGAVVAVFFLLARTAFPTRRAGRVSLFWALLALVVWRGLNPASTLNVSVFAPLFLLHGGLLTAWWCRVRNRAAALPAEDDQLNTCLLPTSPRASPLPSKEDQPLPRDVMLRRTLSLLAALPVSLFGASSAHAQAGQWIGADSASAFVRVELNLARSRGRWGGHVAYTDTRTGQAICRTALRDTSSVGPTLEFTEVLCGGGVLGLRHEGRQMYFERRGASGRPGGISDVVLQYSGPLFAQPIQLGQTVRGRLENGDPVLSNETFYDDYAFTAPSAMSLQITMRSRDLPSYVWVVYGDPPGLKAKGEQNTRGGGTNVEMTVDVPAGPVRIRANTYGKGVQGAYTLQVTASQPAASPGRTAISDQR